MRMQRRLFLLATGSVLFAATNFGASATMMSGRHGSSVEVAPAAKRRSSRKTIPIGGVSRARSSTARWAEQMPAAVAAAEVGALAAAEVVALAAVVAVALAAVVAVAVAPEKVVGATD